jgi:peptidoglycan DL-endopeptidase CwlO
MHCASFSTEKSPHGRISGYFFLTPVSQGGNELTTRSRTLGALALAAVLFLNTVPAFAVPASKLQQAKTVKAQIDKLDARMEIAAERYNVAAEKHAKLVKQQRAAKKKLKKVKKRIGVVQTHLNTRANSMYREGPMGFVDVLLGAESFDEFASTWDVLQGLNDTDASSVSELKVLRTKALAATAELNAKEKAAKKQQNIMKSNRNEIR